MSDGIWDGTDRSKPVRCNYPNPYDPALPCRGILGHSGLHHFGQIGWPDADRVVDTTFTLAEVKAMGWTPPGLPPLSIRERVEEYLTDNGWTYRTVTRWLDAGWIDPLNSRIRAFTLGDALDVQLARDASKEAGK